MPDSASISTLSGTSDRLQERLERQIWFNSEAIIETTRIVVLEVVFIQRPGKFAADLPDKRLEAILQAIFFISHSTRISCGSARKFDQISWWNGITTFAFSASPIRKISALVILSVIPRGFSPYEPKATSI